MSLTVLSLLWRGTMMPDMFINISIGNLDPEQPETRYDRYLKYLESIKSQFWEFGDGWGGDDTPRRMAMRMFPYEVWEGD